MREPHEPNKPLVASPYRLGSNVQAASENMAGATLPYCFQIVIHVLVNKMVESRYPLTVFHVGFLVAPVSKPSAVLVNPKHEIARFLKQFESLLHLTSPDFNIRDLIRGRRVRKTIGFLAT